MNKRPLHHATQGKKSAGPNGMDGYVLLLVIISGLILAIGAMVMSARSINSLIRSSRQSQGDEAKEIAETGASILINELNNNYPYLLTASCQVQNNAVSQQLKNPICTGWNSFTLGQFGGPSTECSGRSSNPNQIMSKLYEEVSSEKGKYRLKNYEFLGDQIQGGAAIIQVQGQRLTGPNDSPTIAASAIVEQEITIAPKCCNKPPFVDIEQCTSGSDTILGLLTKKVTPNGGLDVFGDIHTIDSCPPGMIGTPPSCRNSNSRCEIILNKPKDQITPDEAGTIGKLCNHVSGESSYGNRDFPIAPSWEQAGEAYDIADWDNVQAAMINQSTVIGHDNNIDRNLKDSCITTTENDGKKTTHCRIKSINFSGNQSIELNPGDGYINFYLDDGTCNPSMNISGESVINMGKPNQFSILAGPCLSYPGTRFEKSECNTGWSNKRINISGTSDINAFIYASCADVVVSGNPVTINGSIVAREITANANDVQIVVDPEGDYGSDICNRFDIDICTESNPMHEFVALGSNRWTLIQMERSNNENE